MSWCWYKCLGHITGLVTRRSLCSGEKLIDVQSGRSEELRGVPTVHYTFLFNTFVMMILFNELCARRLDLLPNVFTQLHRSVVFIVIWIASFTTQVCRRRRHLRLHMRPGAYPGSGTVLRLGGEAGDTCPFPQIHLLPPPDSKASWKMFFFGFGVRIKWT